ncbi:coiled-coil domain-containing protein [Caldiplasma sukawensis]
MSVSNRIQDIREPVTFKLLKSTKDFIKSNAEEREITQSEFVEFAIESFRNSSNIEIDKNASNYNKDKSNPSFLMTTKATNEEIYDYLRDNPQACRFIYKKYKENQDFIKELCDPENPLYLKDVADNLMELYQISEMKENLEQIRSEIKKYSIDLDRLKQEIRENEKEYDELESELRTKKKELEDMSKESANIRSDPGLEKINDLLYRLKLIIDVMKKVLLATLT